MVALAESEWNDIKAENRNMMPSNLNIELRDGKIIHTETGSTV